MNIFDPWTHMPRWWWKFLPPSMIKDEAFNEISSMIICYEKEYPYGFQGFMVAPENSLCGNSLGDEARYCELRRIINYYDSL